MINLTRLGDELLAAGIPAGFGLAMFNASYPPKTTYRTYPHVDGTVVVYDWSPTAGQEATATSVIAAHDGATTEQEKLDRIPARGRMLAALLIRASSHWTGLNAARKARIMRIIDNGADEALAMLS